jgi:hypothetical protein
MFNFLALLVVTALCLGLSAEQLRGQTEEPSVDRVSRKLPSLFTILIDLFKKDKDERIIGTYSVTPGNHYTSRGMLPWGLTNKKQIKTKVILSESCATYDMTDTATYKCGVSYWRKFCLCVVSQSCVCFMFF